MNSSSKTFTTRKLTSVTGWLFVFVAMFAAGCSSLNKPESAGFASVIISGQSMEKIRAAAVTVFLQNGYQSLAVPAGELAFQREATRREQLEYAGFAGAHEGEQVLIRVRLGIEQRGTDAYLLSCKAYAVCNPGQAVFETSTPLFGFQSGPYQTLLNNVKGTAQQP